MTQFVGEYFPFPFKVGEKSVTRYMFLKQHEGTNDEKKPSDRTIYVVNVPQYINKKCLRIIFSKYNPQYIYIHKKPIALEQKTADKSIFTQQNILGAKVAYIVFKQDISLQDIFKSNDVAILPKRNILSHIGLKKWVGEYNSSFINPTFVENQINDFMINYDAKVEEKKQKEKEFDGQPDEEGWITITRHSRKSKIPMTERAQTKVVDQQKRATAKKTVFTFYKSQLRDSKMKQITELREKFQKDRERIAQMKANRKFKPF